jgi:uncharacterized membrane protein YfhO
VITWQLEAAEVLSKLSTMNEKLSFVKVPLVIPKQLATLSILQEYQLSSRVRGLLMHNSKKNILL